MPIRRITHVDLPFAEKRHTSNYGPLSAMYSRMGEALADLALRRGQIAGSGYDQLARLYTQFVDQSQDARALREAASRRSAERAEDRAFAERTAAEERKERAAERKAAADLRREEADRSSARFAFSETEAGPVNPVTAALLERFPETAGIVRRESTLPARVTPGAAGEVAPEPVAFAVKEPTADQAERSRARVAMEAVRRDALARTAADDARAERALSQQIRYQDRSLGIQQQQADTAARAADARLGITSNDLPAKYRNPLERAILSAPANRRGSKITHANRLLAEGNETELRDFIRQTAIEGENVDTKNQVLGRMATIASLRDTQAILKELQAKGVSTNILRGTVEDVARALGTTTDPELVSLRNRLAGTLINYRRAATGVAFGEKEGQQYEKMFPNYKNTIDVNDALIGGLMREMQTYDRVYWEHKLGAEGAKAILGDDYAGAQPNIIPQMGTGAPRILSIVPVTRP